MAIHYVLIKSDGSACTVIRIELSRMHLVVLHRMHCIFVNVMRFLDSGVLWNFFLTLTYELTILNCNNNTISGSLFGVNRSTRRPAMTIWIPSAAEPTHWYTYLSFAFFDQQPFASPKIISKTLKLSWLFRIIMCW